MRPAGLSATLAATPECQLAAAGTCSTFLCLDYSTITAAYHTGKQSKHEQQQPD